MSRSDRPHPLPGVEVSDFDPQALDLYLGELHADGSAHLRTLFCTALGCALALGFTPVSTRFVTEATVHSVSPVHPVLAPISGILTWPMDRPLAASGRIRGGEVTAPPHGRPRAQVVRRGQQIAEVVGTQLATLTLQVDARGAAGLHDGVAVEVRPLNGGGEAMVVVGRVTNVNQEPAGGSEATFTVRIALDGDAGKDDTPPLSATDFAAGQRVRVSFETHRGTLWTLLSDGAGARPNAPGWPGTRPTMRGG